MGHAVTVKNNRETSLWLLNMYTDKESDSGTVLTDIGRSLFVDC